MIAALKSGRAFELMEHFRNSIPTSHATSGNSGKKVGLKLRLADGLSRQRQARQKNTMKPQFAFLDHTQNWIVGFNSCRQC